MHKPWKLDIQFLILYFLAAAIENDDGDDVYEIMANESGELSDEVLQGK